MSKEDWRKTHYPCRVCGKKAIACLRPDMDLQGLCYCKKHEAQVKYEYFDIIYKANNK